jgi:hypothetical protein
MTVHYYAAPRVTVSGGILTGKGWPEARQMNLAKLPIDCYHEVYLT